MKSRRLRWADNVARMEEGSNALKILTSTPTGAKAQMRGQNQNGFYRNRYQYEKLG